LVRTEGSFQLIIDYGLLIIWKNSRRKTQEGGILGKNVADFGWHLEGFI